MATCLARPSAIMANVLGPHSMGNDTALNPRPYDYHGSARKGTLSSSTEHAARAQKTIRTVLDGRRSRAYNARASVRMFGTVLPRKRVALGHTRYPARAAGALRRSRGQRCPGAVRTNRARAPGRNRLDAEWQILR